MRLTPLEWGLRAPITPRLGGNCWALPRLGEIGAKRRIINRPKTQNFGYFPTAYLHERAVHLTRFVGEDAQGGSFVREVSSGIGCVLLSDAKQHDQTFTDLPGDVPVDEDAGFAHTLDHSSHRENACATMILGFEERISQRLLVTRISSSVLSLGSHAVLILVS